METLSRLSILVTGECHRKLTGNRQITPSSLYGRSFERFTRPQPLKPILGFRYFFVSNGNPYFTNIPPHSLRQLVCKGFVLSFHPQRLTRRVLRLRLYLY